MFLTTSIAQKNKTNIRLLHITDTHLFANSEDELLGVSTNHCFHLVMEHIEQHQDNYDLIVATGDFVQDGSKEAYRIFASRVAQLSIPCVWLPGNHDMKRHITAVFSQYHLLSEKVVLLGDSWLVILLDSQVDGQAYGYLSQAQLNLLNDTLAQHPNRYILVLLHHHPVMSGCEWLDQHCLKNREVLEDIVMNYVQIRGVGFGHIHQVIEQAWEHCLMFSTPSTCVQFKPNCRDFTLEENSPGWRDIILSNNGTMTTAVKRLDSFSICPDMTLTGYK
ncbi:3',5'-cyclic-AMP phosphodiesterase [Utexia brackfieldae]|uniref:3',5'-cyclic-AMP phosphodiesterase n=1 Tax=Utexia brackfieldae TaxID=3074108 RepID=UPI00370D699F